MRVLVLGSVVYDILVEGVDTKVMGGRYNKIEVPQITVHSGGGAVNVAVNLHAMGAQVDIAGSVGSDEEGQKILNELQQFSVNTDWIEQHSEYPTGKSVIFVTPNGEPKVFVDRGATNQLNLQHVQKIHDDVTMVYSASLAPQAFHALDYLISQHVLPLKVVMNPGMRQLKNLLHVTAIIRLCDVICLNYEEARMMEQTLGKTESHAPEELILALYAAGAKAILITLGSQGAIFYEGKEIYFEAAPAVKVVSALGAGDTFCSSFAYLWLSGVQPQNALQQATLRAKRILGLVGANDLYVGKNVVSHEIPYFSTDKADNIR